MSEDARTRETRGPVGKGAYLVQQGDCIESIAAAHGLFWHTIWDDPENAELRARRASPNALLPGDRVHVRERRSKEVPGATEERHRFRMKGVPSRLVLVLRREGEPRAGLAYTLFVDDAPGIAGVTGADGKIDQPIPPDARRGRLVLPEGETLNLLLGHLDPRDEVSGAQGRLHNLGYACGDPDGELGPWTMMALLAFQRHKGLPATGALDPATAAALEEGK